MKKKLLIIIPVVLVAAVAFFLLRGRGGEKNTGPELPTEFTVGGEPVAALTVGEEEQGVEAARSEVITYTYTGLASPGRAAAGYAAQMADGEDPFRVVDDDFVISKSPNYSEAEGRVLLGRQKPEEEEENTEDEASSEEEPSPSPSEGTQIPSSSPAPEEAEPQEGQVFLLELIWNPEELKVITSLVPGVITQPPPPEPVEPPTSMREAQSYLESLSPAQLGLSGTSMDEYEVFPIDGIELVDGNPCTRINVYSNSNPQSGSEFMGSYLVSMNGRHVYRLTPDTGEIEQLE